MSKALREAIADWLMLIGALLLATSEFLTWSHQFSHAFLARYGSSPALAGIPRDLSAWQVYSVADVLLAVLATGLLAAALRGARAARIAVMLGLIVALLFTLHAAGTPPTHGANLFDPALGSSTPNHPRSGTGELVAMVGIGLGLIGILTAFSAD